MTSLDPRLVLAALWALTLVGCPRDQRVPDAVKTALSGRFLHAAHLVDDARFRALNGGRALACADCHRSTAENRWQPERPGVADHQPCASCHKGAFYTPPGDFCTSCHTALPDPRRAVPADHLLPEWPRRQKHSELVGRFNHRLHLGDPRIAESGGLTCTDCHTVDGSGPYASIPSHQTCAECHADGTRLTRIAAPRLDACASCHVDGGPGRARKYLGNDVGFDHAKHMRLADGTAIECTTCHEAMTRSTSARAADVELPKMMSCRQCHEDRRRTPARVAMSECGVCHVNGVEGAAPGDHGLTR